MAAQPERDALDVLACEIERRPQGAPGLPALAPWLRGMRRAPGALIVALDPAALPLAREIAAAERVCCAEIGWEVDDAPPQLRVLATPEQLDLLQQLFAAERR